MRQRGLPPGSPAPDADPRSRPGTYL
jgi:hypothetical protein